jgi:tetratricopeptide (TPR) repeat protein
MQPLNEPTGQAAASGPLPSKPAKEAASEIRTGSPAEIELRLGTNFRLIGDFTKSEKAYLRALAATERQYGLTHIRVAEALNHLVGLYNAEKNYKLAEIVARRSLFIYESTLGFDHEVTCATSLCLALLCRKQGKDTEAATFYRNSFPKRSNKDEPLTIIAGRLLLRAIEHYKEGQFTEAETLLRYAAFERSDQKWPANLHVGYALTSIADALLAQGHFDESAVLYARALDIFKICLSPQHKIAKYVSARYRLLLSHLFGDEPFVASRQRSSMQLLFRERKTQSLKTLNEQKANRIFKGLSSQLGPNHAMFRASRRLISSGEDA